jgi:hypothetical protein
MPGRSSAGGVGDGKSIGAGASALSALPHIVLKYCMMLLGSCVLVVTLLDPKLHPRIVGGHLRNGRCRNVVLRGQSANIRGKVRLLGCVGVPALRMEITASLCCHVSSFFTPLFLVYEAVSLES